MLYQEKESIIIVSLAGLCALLFLILTFGFGVTPERAFASFSLFALAGFLPILKRRNKAPIDERDKKIAEKASLAGFGVFWVAFVASAMYIYFSLGFEGCIPVVWATNAVIAGMVLLFTARAVAQLILYRTGVL